MVFTKVVENIRIIRKQKGISQESVAYDLGIDYSTYGKIERGKISLTIERLEQIAKILGVSIEDIYKWPDHRNNTSDETGPAGQQNHAALNRCLTDLELAKKELELLSQQLSDKEKIIKLLENKVKGA